MAWMLLVSTLTFAGCAANADPAPTWVIPANSYYNPTPTEEPYVYPAPVDLREPDLATPTSTPEPVPTRTAVPVSVPVATPAPVVAQEVNSVSSPAGGTWSRDEIIAELRRYSWPVEGAIATIQCESGFDQFAQNPSGATGLFQLIGGDPENFDPATNIARAYLKWLDGGGSFEKHWARWGGCGAGW